MRAVLEEALASSSSLDAEGGGEEEGDGRGDANHCDELYSYLGRRLRRRL